MGAYLAFLAHLAVDWDWELSGVALTGLFVGCLLLVAHRGGGERRLARGPRAAGLAAAVAAAVLAFVGLVGNTALAHAQASNRRHHFSDAVRAATTARRWMPWSPAPLQALATARLGLGNASAARAAFRTAISRDPNNWQSWLDFAASVHGKARAEAVAHARALYPRSPEIVEFEKEARAEKSSH
jgi:Flp pilus assembly protein TadD